MLAHVFIYKIWACKCSNRKGLAPLYIACCLTIDSSMTWPRDTLSGRFIYFPYNLMPKSKTLSNVSWRSPWIHNYCLFDDTQSIPLTVRSLSSNVQKQFPPSPLPPSNIHWNTCICCCSLHMVARITVNWTACSIVANFISQMQQWSSCCWHCSNTTLTLRIITRVIDLLVCLTPNNRHHYNSSWKHNFTPGWTRHTVPTRGNNVIRQSPFRPGVHKSRALGRHGGYISYYYFFIPTVELTLCQLSGV